VAGLRRTAARRPPRRARRLHPPTVLPLLARAMGPQVRVAGGCGMRVLFVSNMWPDEERPWYGTFIKTQAESLERIGVEVDVLPIRGYASRRAYLDALAQLRRMTRSN